MKNKDDRYKGANRTTTYKSLLAAVKLITTNDQDEFIKAYYEATHDNGGKSSWNLMQKVDL